MSTGSVDGVVPIRPRDQGEQRHTWRPVDLGPVLDGTYQPPMPTVGARDDGVGLFYPGRVHSVASESEGGKTWLALTAAAHELRAGHAVMYLDFEDDEGGVVGRLLALGAHPDAIRQRFAYMRPETPIGPSDAGDLAAIMGDLHPTMGVIDGVTEAMALHGLEMTDNTDVARFGALLPQPLTARGAAVVMLDHVTKSAETRGRYQIGAVHKLNGLNGAAYLLDNRSPFGIGITGRSTVYIAKDRPGQLRRHALPGSEGRHWFADLVLTSHDVTYVEPSLTVPVERTGPSRPTDLMGRVAAALTTAAAPLTVRGVLDRVKGKTEVIRQALACLVDEGYVTVESGPRGAQLHRLVRPFAE